MHPTLLRFLDPSVALRTLERAQRGEALSEEERSWAQVAGANPDRSKALGERKASPDRQAALVFLAAHAALIEVGKDPELGPALVAARKALLAEGASAEQADELLASALLEEGFGEAGDPDELDRAFLLESFAELPRLAALSVDRLDELTEAFAKNATASARALYRRTSQTLFGEAFEEGPQPINSEHLEAAIARLEAEGELSLPALEALLRHLHAEGLIGARRLQSLEAAIGQAKR